MVPGQYVFIDLHSFDIKSVGLYFFFTLSSHVYFYTERILMMSKLHFDQSNSGPCEKLQLESIMVFYSQCLQG